MGFRVLFILVAIMLLNYTNAQPLGEIDICLFNCEYCFKEEAVLLKCANECLRNGYSKMNPLWKSMCPYFGDLDFMAR